MKYNIEKIYNQEYSSSSIGKYMGNPLFVFCNRNSVVELNLFLRGYFTEVSSIEIYDLKGESFYNEFPEESFENIVEEYNLKDIFFNKIREDVFISDDFKSLIENDNENFEFYSRMLSDYKKDKEKKKIKRKEERRKRLEKIKEREIKEREEREKERVKKEEIKERIKKEKVKEENEKIEKLYRERRKRVRKIEEEKEKIEKMEQSTLMKEIEEMFNEDFSSMDKIRKDCYIKFYSKVESELKLFNKKNLADLGEIKIKTLYLSSFFSGEMSSEFYWEEEFEENEMEFEDEEEKEFHKEKKRKIKSLERIFQKTREEFEEEKEDDTEREKKIKKERKRGEINKHLLMLNAILSEKSEKEKKKEREEEEEKRRNLPGRGSSIAILTSEDRGWSSCSASPYADPDHPKHWIYELEQENEQIRYMKRDNIYMC